MAKLIPVVVTLNAAALEQGAAFVTRLKELGLTVDSILGTMGVITGKITENKIQALSKIAGITVERDQEVRLAPPDADVQ